MRISSQQTLLLRASLFLNLIASLYGQSLQTSTSQPQPPPAAPTTAATTAFNPSDYLPVCSTEKVNGDCFVNIDRRYPITLPTYQMRRGSHITVYVFHPFPFESLTLDPGPAQAYEGSDQAAGILNALVPTLGKGLTLGTAEPLVASGRANDRFMMMTADLNKEFTEVPPQTDAGKRAKEILDQIQKLNGLLDQALDPVTKYIGHTRTIYTEVREIELAAPRPVDRRNLTFRTPGIPVPPGPNPTPNPWDDYPGWRDHMITQLTEQGTETTDLLSRLPGSCQKPGEVVPVGPWAPARRPCDPATVATMPPSDPLRIPAEYETLNITVEQYFIQLQLDPTKKPDDTTYNKIQQLKDQLDQRHQRVVEAVTYAVTLLPSLITKISTDMQTTFVNISLARDPVQSPTFVGVIPSPLDYKHQEEGKVLKPYKPLGPQITFTVNAQNEIANSLFALPAASQKQAVASITALYAAPRFEVSAGALLSWLPNPTFSNKTTVNVVNDVPAPVDVKIDMTKAIPPLVIPFTAANYRISSEYDWIGGRRSAFYATLGIGFNPYDTQVEYIGGLSFSWRFLMFSPLYHLGHGVHLTQGEQVGQIWCQYGAALGSTPPPCAGSPPAPSTTNFWRGGFALGISVRVPTTFNASNH